MTAPVVRAFRSLSSRGYDLLTVVGCPYCGRDHLHGAGDRPGDGDGHRVAHCGGHFPEASSIGYVLREWLDGEDR